MGTAWWTRTTRWWAEKEKVLTTPVDHKTMQCLDYIMRVRHKDSRGEEVYKIDHNLVDVEKFFVDHKLITQLSDHYALKAVLVLAAEELKEKKGDQDVTLDLKG